MTNNQSSDEPTPEQLAPELRLALLGLGETKPIRKGLGELMPEHIEVDEHYLFRFIPAPGSDDYAHQVEALATKKGVYLPGWCQHGIFSMPDMPHVGYYDRNQRTGKITMIHVPSDVVDLIYGANIEEMKRNYGDGEWEVLERSV